LFADARRPAWSRWLATAHGSGQVKGYLRSVEYDLGLDGRGAGTILMVDDLIRADADAVASMRLQGRGDYDE